MPWMRVDFIGLPFAEKEEKTRTNLGRIEGFNGTKVA